MSSHVWPHLQTLLYRYALVLCHKHKTRYLAMALLSDSHVRNCMLASVLFAGHANVDCACIVSCYMQHLFVKYSNFAIAQAFLESNQVGAELGTRCT